MLSKSRALRALVDETQRRSIERLLSEEEGKLEFG
jgi:hypothetical protein